MKKNVIVLFLFLLTCVFDVWAQQVCNLMLVPESNNLCILENNAYDFSMIRACRGNTVSYRAYSPSAVNYEWTVVGGSYQLNSDSTICNVTWGEGIGGIVTVQALMPDSTICTSQIQVVLEDKPLAGVISTPNYIVNVNNPEEKFIEVCAGDTLSFVDNSTSGMLPIVDYYWEYPYGISNNRSISFVARDPGVHCIIHKVYNECGCYDEILIKLIVRDECPLDLSCFGTACAYSQHTYSIQSPDCSDYLWSAEGGTIVSHQHNPDVTVQWDAPESGYGTLYLDGTSCSCQCKSRKSIKIPVISNNVGITGPDTLCLNNQYTFSVPLWGATQYDWEVTPNTGIIMSADNNSLTFTPQQEQTYTITVTYSCNFLDCGPYTSTKVVEAKKNLNINVAPSSQEMCIGSSLSFSTNTNATSQWTVEWNDSIIQSLSASTFSYTFDTGGIYSVRAWNANYCNEAVATIVVKDNPPAPANIMGPDTICPNYTAEYSATPSSPENLLLWEWNQDGEHHSHVGNKVNITFGQNVEDIYVYQMNRKTGCRSDATVYHVSPFRLAPWPYRDLVRVCQGQTVILSSLQNQSDNDVLYEWKVYPAYALSIQGSHLNADVKLLANYTNDLPTTVQLILKRTYCHTYRYDTAYVRIGEIDPPTIMHDPICMGQSTPFSVVDTSDADGESCYWYLDDDSGHPEYGMPVSLYFQDTDPHVVHLHYVSKYGCEIDASDTVTACPSLPAMHIDMDGNTLSVVIEGDTTGYSYRWMTGETTSSIVVPTTSYYQCEVTSPYCGCTRTFSLNQGSSPECVFVDSAFSIVNHCDNIISIGSLSGYGLSYPMTVRLSQGGHSRYVTVIDRDQRMLVPDTGAYAITVYWNSGDTCYYFTHRDTIATAIKIQLKNDCLRNLIVSAQRTDGTEVHFTAMVSQTQSGLSLGTATGTTRVRIPMPEADWFRLLLQFGSSDCFFDTIFQFDDPPTIHGINIQRNQYLCEDTPFSHVADATGEGLVYEWNFGDGSRNYGNGIDHVYGDQRSHTVSLIVTDRNGCTSTFSTNVTISGNYLESYDIDQSYAPLCPGDSAVIQTHSGSNTYSWSPCYQFTGDLAYVYEAGTYIVDITSNREQCRYQLEHNVPYPNGPFASILCDSTYCFGEMAELIGDIGEDFSYQWHIRSAHASNSSTSSNFNFNITDTGSHQVILTVTDANGCTSSDTVYFYVHPIPAAPTLQFCGNRCITAGPVELCSSSGQSLFWSNGTKGSSTQYFTDGSAAAYYIDAATGCKSNGATILIPEAPDFDGLLTGCYCIDKHYLPTTLSLYTLGGQDSLPWEWFDGYDPIGVGTLPPSPSQLKIPTSGTYHLVVPDYGMGCQAVSPNLVIETKGCESPIIPNSTPLVVGFVVKKVCVLNGCRLEYYVTVRICNDSTDQVCIDNIFPTLPIIYNVTSGLPMTLSPGECEDVTLMMQYNLSSPSSFLFVMACREEPVGVFWVSLSDWMDCVQPDTCQIQATPSFSIDSTLSEPNQSAFFNFTLTFPSLSGTVISVGCDQGQIIDGNISGSSYSGLLMMDYGLMTQMVVDSADFCFHIVCCDNGRICVSAVCIPYYILWEICGQLAGRNRSKGGGNTPRERPIEGEKRFVLVPNPASSWVKVEEQGAPLVSDEIRLIEVFSMNGQKVVSAESSNQFDASPLSGGAYIVKVVTSAGRHEYLKLIKK